MTFRLDLSDSGYLIHSDWPASRFMMGTRSVVNEQDYLRQIFPTTLPKFTEGETKGQWVYELDDGRDIGRIRLPLTSRDTLQDFVSEVAEYDRLRNQERGIRHLHATLLREFHLPDPRKHPDCYRIREYSDGRRRVVVLWGLDAPDGDRVRPDQALALMRESMARVPESEDGAYVIRNPGAGRIVLNSVLLLLLMGMIIVGTRTYWDRFNKRPEVYDAVPVKWIDSTSEPETLWSKRLDVPSAGQVTIGDLTVFENHDRHSKPVWLFTAKPGCYDLKITPIGIDTDDTPGVEWMAGGEAMHRPNLILSEGDKGALVVTPLLSCARQDTGDHALYLFEPGSEEGVPVSDAQSIVVVSGSEDNSKPLVLVLSRDDGTWDYDMAWPGTPQRFAPLPKVRIVRWERVDDAYEAILEDAGSYDPDGEVSQSRIDWGDGETKVVDWNTGPDGPPYRFRHRYPIRALRPEIHYSVVDDQGLASIAPVVIPSASDPIVLLPMDQEEAPAPGEFSFVETIVLRDAKGKPMARIEFKRNPGSEPDRWRYSCHLTPVYSAPFEWISDVSWEIVSGLPSPEKVRFRTSLEFEGGGSLAVKVQCRTRLGNVSGHYVFTPPHSNP